MQITARKKKPEQPVGPRVLLEHECVTIHHGDCLKVMASMPEASVDTIVTDPPYGLEFMGKEWDKLGNTAGRDRHQAIQKSSFAQIRGTGTAVPRIVRSRRRKCSVCGLWSGGTDNMICKCTSSKWIPSSYGNAMQSWHEAWARAALRIAKPGAMLLSFGGTRTFHRLACAIEDAGWELRDCMMWVYGSGFPKSLNISKAIDKEAGAEREVVGQHERSNLRAGAAGFYHLRGTEGEYQGIIPLTAPATEAAALWNGWGTALKPAWEPIILAMKPLDGTFAANALAHGVAGLWVDGGRVGFNLEQEPDTGHIYYARRGLSYPERKRQHGKIFPQEAGSRASEKMSAKGRWPANVVLSHDERCVCVGTTQDPGYTIYRWKDGMKPFGDGAGHPHESEQVPGGERDLYACVPSCPVRILDSQSGPTKDNKGFHKQPPQSKNYDDNPVHIGGRTAGTSAFHYGDSGGASRFFYTTKASTSERHLGCAPGYQNHHPTVKPLDLCRYLCRLTKTPTGGVVLDPFSGSGSIAVAALLEGRSAIAIELEEESANATVARVQAALKYGDKLQELKRYRVKGRRKLKRRR